ncbi:Ig-like domain repeat protein [Leifsonia poae]|uniref:Ig-like domain repeat protein n=1 Tax=Leifsonia poae TaxID=110933 RepID=UPI001CC007AC|nr:Ig-like domain repeat protein [Leifsonia poae]
MSRTHASIRAACALASLGLALLGVAVIAPAAMALPPSASTVPATSPADAVTPVVDCVVDASLDSGVAVRTVVFGYRSSATAPVSVPAGAAANLVTPGATDRGQPSAFLPGDHHGVWTVTVDPVAAPTTWLIGSASAAADQASPPCATVTTVVLSAPATVATGDTVTLTAAVTRMLLAAPDTGRVEFAVDANDPVRATVAANGVARVTLPAPASGAHTVTAHYVPADGSPLLGSRATATLTVSAASGALSIMTPVLSPSADQAVLTVTRASDAGTASVDYTTADGSAVAGTDYTATRGRLVLAEGQRSATIIVPLAHRPAGSAAATFFVLLQRASTTVDAAGAAVALPAVPYSRAGAGVVTLSDSPPGAGPDSALPAIDPTAPPLKRAGEDLMLMIGAALLTVGGILGVVGLVRFGGSREAKA